MNKNFENLNYLQEVKLTNLEKAKRSLNKAIRGTVIGLAIVGLISMAYVATHLDTSLFTLFYPDSIQKAIMVHNKGTQAGMSYETDFYSRLIK